jgi:hypothetical protein
MPTEEATKKSKPEKATESSWSKYVDFLFGKKALEEAAGKKPKKKPKKSQDTGYIRKRIKETKFADDEDK